jgi:glycosyltransferase involved in cell wall biosynthesis
MRRPLLISHDLSYSGAPIALLALANALKRLGEDPLVVALSGGPLAVTFLESGFEIGNRIDPAGISFVIANTIISVPTALQFKRFRIPVAAWLHESDYFFRHLQISPAQQGLGELDLVLTPASFQIRQLQEFLPPGGAYQLRNVVRQSWFRPAADESMFAVCGQWELRKGQTQLLELARHAQANCRFKFIGARPPPGGFIDPATTSLHRFLGPIDSEAAKREIARCDALVSCAEAEVQPLSAIEALMAGRPALLSDIEAHRALARLIPNVFLFDRLSPDSFHAGISGLRLAAADTARAREASAKARELFGEPAFDRRLAEILRVLRKEEASGVQVARLQDL